MSVEEIGQRLKLARDNSGLSLAHINERTKIPFNHLESIERGHFDDLPEPVYVAGFIKRYADCVGLDAQQMVDEYRQELNHQNAPPEKPGFLFKHRKNHTASIQPNYYNRQPIKQAPPNLMKMIPFYALWVIIILGLIIYLFNRQESIDLAQQDPGILALKQSTNQLHNAGEPETTPNTKETQTAPAEKSNSQTVTNPVDEPATGTAEINNNQLTLLAKKHVWVEVKANSSGEALYTGFMEAGTSHNFSDPEGLRIRAGNAGNVQVTFAGKTEDLGVIGKIAERIFTNHISKTASVKSPSVEKREIVSTHHTDLISTSNAKKSAEKPVETITSAKKPLVATGTKRTSSNTANAPGIVHKYEGVGGENKGIDVPYRYNE